MLTGKGLLTPEQRAFIRIFTGIPDQSRFYLTDGTALSEFYFGHRLSFDLDLFTSDEQLILPVSYQIEEAHHRANLQLSITRRFASYVELLVSLNDESVKVDLALDSPFRFAKPVESEIGVLVNDFEDLQIDKLLAYYGRAEPRDAVDLFFILEQADLDQLLEKAGQKDPGFDLYWFAVALNRAESFPDEIDRWPVKMISPINAIQVKQTFKALAMDLMKRLEK